MTQVKVTPFSLKDSPSLIERILPVQKISAEAYKEQMAGAGKTLAPLGSYWKGRKPLILNRACVLGCLLPATSSPEKDLEVFEILMGMDTDSLKKRLQLDLTDNLPHEPYRKIVSDALRPEEVPDYISDNAWKIINAHLNTHATNIGELIEQLGIMRFGHRPKVADAFSGSGQIPFEAARLGCDVYAGDLNPVACLLTWGAFNVVGSPNEKMKEIKKKQATIIKKVNKKIEILGLESEEDGWKPKVYLYCVESKCPQTGWLVPLLPTLILSKQRTGDKFNAIAVLVPDKKNKKYNIEIKTCVSDEELEEATKGTVRSGGRGQEPYLFHVVDGKEYRTKISTLRGDYTDSNGETKNKLRIWDKEDFTPQADDIYQERLYAIQWISTTSNKYEFRSVTPKDLKKEQKVIDYIQSNIKQWQKNGVVPDMKIEAGDKTDEPIRTRGWAYWHQLFNPRQLLIAALINEEVTDGVSALGLTQVVNWNSRLAGWNFGSGGGGSVQQTFYNQALNTFYNYGARSFDQCKRFLNSDYAHFPLRDDLNLVVNNAQASEMSTTAELIITDPPYGDAVKYEEITEFFIAWLRKNKIPEFSKWTWDSRRSIAIKGEDESFRKGMVEAYSNLTNNMNANGLQVIMFTHQSGSLWADMANIVWASGLQVTAAWYVVTETDSALRDGSYVKGTVLLVLRKRNKNFKTTRDDLAWEIQEEVENQVKELTGLNQEVRIKNRDENVFEDADLQMAGYAAALRVLTKYSVIDGREMMAEAIRPRVRGEATFVDSLIEFAVSTANQTLVPAGIAKNHWEKLLPAERFILKMTDLEIKGVKTLDNYQNFAKAFKVRDFTNFMQSKKANEARLKSAFEFGKAELGEGSELHFSTIRAIYFAMMEIINEVDSNEVLQHLSFNVKDYYSSGQQRELALALSQYLGSRLESLRPEEASAARVLSELIRNQRLG